MAQIITYPKLSTLANNDLLLISDVSSKNKNTNSVELQTLANFITTSTSGITGGGTLNTIAMFTPDGQRIGDSIITYDDTSIPIITIGPQPSRLTVDGDLTVTNRASFGGPYVEFDGTIEVNGAIRDGSFLTGTAGQVLSSTGTGVQWIDTVTGSGTTDFVPKFTDGPNGVIGDSFIKSYVAFPGTGNEQNIVEIDPPAGANPNLLIVNTGRFSRIETDTIIASDTGSVTMNGNVNIGNANTDELNIASTTNIWNAPVKAGPTPFGALAPGADYVLASTSSSSRLEWKSQEDYVSGAIAKLIPTIIVASAGASDTYSDDNNIVELQWTGGNGTYTLNVPSATDIPYRVIRFITDGTFPGGASHKINITAQAGETIDGNPDFEISKVYEGVSIWSTGTEWIVIQAKAH